MKEGNILLLGSTGYVGRDIKEVLIRQGHNLFSPSRDELNCTESSSLTSYLVKQRISTIVMSVARPFNDSTSSADARELFASNLKAESTIISSAKALKISSLIHIGSSSIFQGSIPVENVALDRVNVPNSLYAKGKYLTSASIELQRNTLGLNWVNLIIPGIIGPYRENLTANSYLIPSIVEKCREGLTLRVPERVLYQKREWVSTIDIGKTLSILLRGNLSSRLPNGRLNMSPPSSYLVSDVIEYVQNSISTRGTLSKNLSEQNLPPRAKTSQSLISLELEGLEYSSMISMLNWLIKKTSIGQVSY